jgi:hypothetical protein
MVHNVVMKISQKPIDPKYLVPLAPKAAWDGWFAISIFPPGSHLRWLKAHLYSRSCPESMQPFSLVEGLGENCEVCIMWATETDVEVRQSEVGVGKESATVSPMLVDYDENFTLTGTWPQYRMMFALPGGHPTAHFEFEAGWPIWWSKYGRFLQYVGQHSKVNVRLSDEDKALELDGFGIIEHVAGAAAPFDITSIAPMHYHWDVLVFADGSSPTDSGAGLSFGAGGATLIPLKAALKLPGSEAEKMRGLWVRYLELGTMPGLNGEKIAVPLKWEGVMRSLRGTLRYTATASTPVATVIPGGGMLGFEFQGRWVESGTRPSILRGYGFSEYGDFSGGLLRVAER